MAKEKQEPKKGIKLAEEHHDPEESEEAIHSADATPDDVVEPVPEEEVLPKKEKKEGFDTSSWHPKTALGTKVKNREITNIDHILDKGLKIMETQIVDVLLPDMETELLLIGQSKGKFGGGQRRVFKQTQKKTREGNKPKFATFAVIGNKNGYIGGGYGKSKETVPAREKAFRNSKLSIFKIRRGCGSWQCNCNEPHSIPFVVIGKCGSTELELIPAPKGKGLCVEPDCAKILQLAGIKDVWSKTRGQTKTRLNVVRACINALRSLMQTKVNPLVEKELNIVEGAIRVKIPEDQNEQ